MITANMPCYTKTARVSIYMRLQQESIKTDCYFYEF